MYVTGVWKTCCHQGLDQESEVARQRNRLTEIFALRNLLLKLAYRCIQFMLIYRPSIGFRTNLHHL